MKKILMNVVLLFMLVLLPGFVSAHNENIEIENNRYGFFSANSHHHSFDEMKVDNIWMHESNEFSMLRERPRKNYFEQEMHDSFMIKIDNKPKKTVEYFGYRSHMIDNKKSNNNNNIVGNFWNMNSVDKEAPQIQMKENHNWFFW